MVSHLHSSLRFVGKARSLLLDSLGLHWVLWSLPANIRPGWKWLTVMNTLVYYDTEFITTLMRCIVQAIDNSCSEFSFTVQSWDINSTLLSCQIQQGSLTEREGSVQLTSLYQLVHNSCLSYCNHIFLFYKGGLMYWVFHLSKGSLHLVSLLMPLQQRYFKLNHNWA